MVEGGWEEVLEGVLEGALEALEGRCWKEVLEGVVTPKIPPPSLKQKDEATPGHTQNPSPLTQAKKTTRNPWSEQLAVFCLSKGGGILGVTRRLPSLACLRNAKAKMKQNAKFVGTAGRQLII